MKRIGGRGVDQLKKPGCIRITVEAALFGPSEAAPGGLGMTKYGDLGISLG